MTRITVVELTDEEQAVHDSIHWDVNELSNKGYDDRIESLERMGELTESLLKRKAIPKCRLDYFLDPAMNVVGLGKSRKEVFEKNGTSGGEILRQPHFMPYLHYFIFGPNLPKTTIDGFCRIIEEDRGTSGMVLDQICAFVRKEVRDKELSPHEAADEFFKLAHEIDKPNLAENVRSAAMSARR